MSVFVVMLGWLMVIAAIVCVLVARLAYKDSYDTDTKYQLFDAFRPYLLGLALLFGVIGSAILKSNGVDLDLPGRE